MAFQMIPPRLSSSPPPLDSLPPPVACPGVDDDDDEFDAFSSSHNASFDITGLSDKLPPTPDSSPTKIPGLRLGPAAGRGLTEALEGTVEDSISQDSGVDSSSQPHEFSPQPQGEQNDGDNFGDFQSEGVCAGGGEAPSIQHSQDGGSSQLQPQKSEEDTARHRISCSPPPLDHVAEGTVTAEKGFAPSVSSFLPPEDDDDFGDFADFASHEPAYDHLQTDTKATGAASGPQQVNEEDSVQCKKEMNTTATSSGPQEITAEEDTPCKPDMITTSEVGENISDHLGERPTSEGQLATPSHTPDEGVSERDDRELEALTHVSDSVGDARTGATVEVDSGVSDAVVGDNRGAEERDVKDVEPSSDKGSDNEDFGDFSRGVVDTEGPGTGTDRVVAEERDVKKVEPSSDANEKDGNESDFGDFSSGVKDSEGPGKASKAVTGESDTKEVEPASDINEKDDDESDFGDFSSGVKDSEGPGVGEDRVVAEGSGVKEVEGSSNKKNDDDASDFGDFNRASDDDDDDDLDFDDLRKRVQSGSLDDDFGDFSSGDAENKEVGGSCNRVQGSVEEVGDGDDKGSDGFGDFTAPGNTEDKSGFDDFGDFEGPVNEGEDFSTDDFGDFTAPENTKDTSDFGDFSNFGDFEGHANEGEGGDGVTQDFSTNDFGDFSAPGTSTDLQGFSTASGSAAAAVKEATQQFTPSEGGVSKANPVLQKLESLVAKWIPSTPTPVQDEGCPIPLLHQAVESDAFVWRQLENLESSAALRLSWSTTQAHTFFLSSVNVDARNILFGQKWSSSVPLFAQTLSFSPLTPAKSTEGGAVPGGAVGGVGLSGAAKELPQDIPAATTVRYGQHKGGEAVCDPAAASRRPDRGSEEQIPPAKFDWTSSGLTNPLEGPGLEQEFLSEGADKSASVRASKTPPAPSPLVQQILGGGMNKAPVPATPLQSLAPEVREVVTQLPDLSFMRSRVLMFPIRGVQ